MDIRTQLEIESFKKYAKMSVARKLQIALELSQFAFALNCAIKKKEKNERFGKKPKKNL